LREINQATIERAAEADRHTPVCLLLEVVLLKFTFIIFSAENLSFGHLVASFSLCVAYACLLKSNLRLSSTDNILRLFVFLQLFPRVQISLEGLTKKAPAMGAF
jgi:hypothetical protein